MERLSEQKPAGLNGNALRTWGLLFLAAGMIARGLIQTRLLGIGKLSAAQLLEVMNGSQGAMLLATLSLVLQAMETCAAPIFAFLLVNGVERTSDFRAYFLRVSGLALVSELPYNFAIDGRLAALDSRNPVFGLVLCMIMLYFYRRYGGKGVKNFLIRMVVTVAAVVWGMMLGIDSGSCMVLLVAVLWAFRRKPLYRNFAGAAVTVLCTAISPFFLAAPMGFLVVHFYNGEKATTGKAFRYLAYPALLLAVGLAGLIV